MKFQLIPAIQASVRLLERFALFSHSLIFSLAVLFVSNAQGFTITEGDVVTVTQSLDDDNSIGRIEDGAALQTNGDSILSSGNGVQLLNYGEIETSDAYSVSFASSGNNVTVFNAGTGVSDGAFLVSGGDDLFLENSGYLESRLGQVSSVGFPLSLGYTIYTSGGSAVLENYGEIQASAESALAGVFAVLSEGGNATITNFSDGRIYSDGAGIATHGAGAIIVNEGYIQTQASKTDFTGFGFEFNAPIHSSGDLVQIINSGELVASGNSSDGIFSSGMNASIVNTGRVRAGVPFQGVDDFTIGNGTGIFSVGSFAEIVNSGVITQVQVGIDSSGTDSKIVNDGLIEVSGHISPSGVTMQGYGVWASGENSMVEHGGTIVGKDIVPEIFSELPYPIEIPGLTNGVALDPFGVSNGIADISGQIFVSSNAILGGDGEQVVTFREGAQMTGTIDLGGGIDTVNVGMTGSSASLTFLNVENINLLSEVTGVVVGDSVHVVDASVFSYQTQTLNSLVSRAHGSMLRRSQFEGATDPLWVEASATGFDYDGNHKMGGYEHDASIFNMGYQIELEFGQAGFLAGYSEGDIRSDQLSFEDEIQSYYMGAYYRFPIQSLNMTTSILIGREEHKQQRFSLNNLSGYEKAEATPDSYFISPSVSIDWIIPVTERFSLIPSGTLSYTLSRIESYGESGAASNLSVDERFLHIGNFQSELAAVYQFERVALALVGGLDVRYSDDSPVEASIGGQGLTIDPVNDRTVTAGFIAARASIRISKNVSLSTAIENRIFEDGDEIFGSARLGWSF